MSCAMRHVPASTIELLKPLKTIVYTQTQQTAVHDASANLSSCNPMLFSAAAYFILATGCE